MELERKSCYRILEIALPYRKNILKTKKRRLKLNMLPRGIGQGIFGGKLRVCSVPIADYPGGLRECAGLYAKDNGILVNPSRLTTPRSCCWMFLPGEHLVWWSQRSNPS